MTKEVIFLGDSEDVLANFPKLIKSQLGFEIFMLEQGLQPPSAEPMSTVGQGVWELKAKDGEKQYRVFYYVKRDDNIYILHSFTKKTQKTPEAEKRKAKARYKTLFH